MQGSEGKVKLIFLSALMLLAFGGNGQQSFSLPLNSLKLTSYFGSRVHPVTGKHDFHKGVDFSARCEPVLSVLAGEVTATGCHPILGNFVRIKHDELESIYGHLRMICTSIGEAVDAGSFIGITGNTGRSTGEHLHFAVRFRGNYLDPLAFLLGLSKIWEPGL